MVGWSYDLWFSIFGSNLSIFIILKIQLENEIVVGILWLVIQSGYEFMKRILKEVMQMSFFSTIG